MLLRFTKMHGLGNDFMVVNAVTQKVFLTAAAVTRLGDRHLGVGFDQLLLVEPPYDPEVDFHYRIFNRDGGEVRMCGNGARCFARFVFDHRLTRKRSLRVSTAAGVLQLRLHGDGNVSVDMGVPDFTPTALPFTAPRRERDYPLRLPDGRTVRLGAVSMGNPHCVLFFAPGETLPVEVWGPWLERHPAFPERVNVGFARVTDEHALSLRVYERGCGETRACGSGACAAAAVAITQGRVRSPVQVQLPGGTLRVSWPGEGEPLVMTGGATRVFEGTVMI